MADTKVCHLLSPAVADKPHWDAVINRPPLSSCILLTLPTWSLTMASPELPQGKELLSGTRGGWPGLGDATVLVLPADRWTGAPLGPRAFPASWWEV